MEGSHGSFSKARRMRGVGGPGPGPVGFLCTEKSGGEWSGGRMTFCDRVVESIIDGPQWKLREENKH